MERQSWSSSIRLRRNNTPHPVPLPQGEREPCPQGVNGSLRICDRSRTLLHSHCSCCPLRFGLGWDGLPGWQYGSRHVHLQHDHGDALFCKQRAPLHRVVGCDDGSNDAAGYDPDRWTLPNDCPTEARTRLALYACVGVCRRLRDSVDSHRRDRLRCGYGNPIPPWRVSHITNLWHGDWWVDLGGRWRISTDPAQISLSVTVSFADGIPAH